MSETSVDCLQHIFVFGSAIPPLALVLLFPQLLLQHFPFLCFFCHFTFSALLLSHVPLCLFLLHRLYILFFDFFLLIFFQSLGYPHILIVDPLSNAVYYVTAVQYFPEPILIFLDSTDASLRSVAHLKCIFKQNPTKSTFSSLGRHT